MPLTSSHKDQDLGDISKQRASKACNRCRAKKARCSGGYPCSKCKSSDAVCIFSYPKKSKRRTFPEQYVRALETQQFKLVAGLQTMYFMLRAADSWPGARLTEQKGTPLVHDILDRLGLLKPDKDRHLESEMDHYGFDHPSDTDEASTIQSPQRSQHEIEQSSMQRSLEPSASPQSVGSQQQDCSMASESEPRVATWHSQPTQPHSYPFAPSELPREFVLRPPPRMTASLPDTSPPSQNAGATMWAAINGPESWWHEHSQLSQDTSLSRVGFIPELPAVLMADDVSPSMALTLHDQNSYLTDPGVYACDLDME